MVENHVRSRDGRRSRRRRAATAAATAAATTAGRAARGPAPARAFRTISAFEPFENANDATLSHDTTAPMARLRSSSFAGPVGAGPPSGVGCAGCVVGPDRLGDEIRDPLRVVGELRPRRARNLLLGARRQVLDDTACRRRAAADTRSSPTRRRRRWRRREWCATSRVGDRHGALGVVRRGRAASRSAPAATRCFARPAREDSPRRRRRRVTETSTNE